MNRAYVVGSLKKPDQTGPQHYPRGNSGSVTTTAIVGAVRHSVVMKQRDGLRMLHIVCFISLVGEREFYGAHYSTHRGNTRSTTL